VGAANLGVKMPFGKRTTPPNAENKTAEEHVAAHAGNQASVDLEQPSHIQRLIKVMSDIQDDAQAITSSVQRTSLRAHLASDALVTLRGTPACLFENRSPGGGTHYNMYFFTEDFRNLQPAAQFELCLLFGQVSTFNKLFGSSTPEKILTDLLDSIIVKSMYFSHYFRSFDLSTLLMTLALKGLLDRNSPAMLEMRAYVQNGYLKFEAAREKLFMPESFSKYLPSPGPKLLVESSSPYEEGQKSIMGVFVPPKYVDQFYLLLTGLR
jgi:hypothetical protein